MARVLLSLLSATMSLLFFVVIGAAGGRISPLPLVEQQFWVNQGLIAGGLPISPLPVQGRDEGRTTTGRKQTYIVHVQHPVRTTFSNAADKESWYRSFLPANGLASVEHSDARLLYAYHNVISGFAARLTAEEYSAVRQKEGFVEAYPDSLVELHTTRTPAYLGLGLNSYSGLWQDTQNGSGVIIGLLDTGITPGHPSFGDDGMLPPPSTWNGSCQSPVVCNNKLIGAKAFGDGIQAMYGLTPKALVSSGEEEEPSVTADPIDAEGHGTHTASTAAGRFVANASLYGQAAGTVSGIAPDAWLAIYRVCYPNVGCANSDILAAFDAALSDGVDILSLSLGGSPIPFYRDSIAIGAFSAMQQGVFVSCSAGNSGPTAGTVSNSAPWMLTVAAGTLDRTLKTRVVLGDGHVFEGQSLSQPATNVSFCNLPIIYPGADGTASSRLCSSLNRTMVAGKIVVCDASSLVDAGSVVKSAGGVAMILVYSKVAAYNIRVKATVLPSSTVSYPHGSAVKAYAAQATTASATIQFLGTTIGLSPSAPMAAYFSSRGPSVTNTDLIKPDILGPGVDVLAAWYTQVGPAVASAPFNIISGTSMSAPHLTGVAALLKSAHPDWSAAAIRSAMMTTSGRINNAGQPITDENDTTASSFVIGAGQVNPQKAANPGLVYDLTSQSYIEYLCSIKYTDDQVNTITHSKIKCADQRVVKPADLNYPSISVTLNRTVGSMVTITRTVTNVGDSTSNYEGNLSPSSGFSAQVQPSTLQFTSENEQQQFNVTFTANSDASGLTYSEGFLIWSSPKTGITVQSPIMVKFV